MRIQVGDLVSLYRRTTPGLGVIITKIDDVADLTKNGESDIKKLVSSWNAGLDFKTRNRAISAFIEESKIEDDLAISFLQSNGFYRYSQKKTNKDYKKIKRTYVKVMWLRRPSDYNVTITRRKIDWFPHSWLRILKENIDKEMEI